MKKPTITLFIIMISFLLLSGCAFRTPMINGVVIDEETKQPMKAWVIVTAATETRTPGGASHTVSLINKGWTGDDGRFSFSGETKILSPANFLPPLSWGASFKKLSIFAHGSECREGEKIYYMKDKETKESKYWTVVDGYWDLKDKLKDVVINLKRIKSESEQFHDLQILYDYCKYGQYNAANMDVDCDILDFLIEEHEKFLEGLGELTTGDQRNNFAGIKKQLAYLFEKKGNYKKSLELFIELKEFDEKIGSKIWLNEYERKINDLKKILYQNPK